MFGIDGSTRAESAIRANTMHGIIAVSAVTNVASGRAANIMRGADDGS